MGEYERMVIDFVAIVSAPHLGLLLLAVALIALAAALTIRRTVTRAAIAPVTVLLMVSAWATTVSSRVVVVEKRARAPSAWELIRV